MLTAVRFLTSKQSHTEISIVRLHVCQYKYYDPGHVNSILSILFSSLCDTYMRTSCKLHVTFKRNQKSIFKKVATLFRCAHIIDLKICFKKNKQMVDQ